MKVDKAKKFAANPRRISDERLALLRKHLETLGDLSGVVYCTKNKAYLGGNQRSEIMDGCEIEITERFAKPTPQKTRAHGFITFGGEKFAYREVAFTEAQFKQACIVANSNGGEWDWETLGGSDWNDRPLEDWGLDLPENWGAGSPGLDDETAVAGMVDQAAELNKKWKVRPGDLWQIGKHRLLCGDATSAEDVGTLFAGGGQAKSHGHRSAVWCRV